MVASSPERLQIPPCARPASCAPKTHVHEKELNRVNKNTMNALDKLENQYGLVLFRELLLT
jgi:hypothetical protein